jgi:tetratricopeptide (TPR) repeat protein
MESVLGDQAEEQAGALAHHFSAAGDVAKAYLYHGRAADAAQRVYAVEPALAQYNAALEAGAQLGLEADREPAVRGLLLRRGKLRWRTGDSGGTADLELVLDAARRAGDRVIEMETLNELGILDLTSDLDAAAAFHRAALVIARELDDRAAQTQALDRLAVISSHLLEFDRALELGEEAFELARGTGDETMVGRANDSIKLAVWWLGELSRLEELTAELEALWRERSDLWYLQWTLLESAFVPLGRARWDEAAERLDDALAINRRVGDPGAQIQMLDALGWLHRSTGAYEQALSAGRQAVALAAEVGEWQGWAAATLGWTLLDLGAAAQAAEVLERGLAAGERTGARFEIVRCLGQLAWARWLLGSTEEASALAARAETLLAHVSAPPGGAFLFGAHAYAAVARVLLATGSPERGEALLLPVLTAAERSGWLEAAATCELVLGLCFEARGELDRAVVALTHAAELADEPSIPAPGWEAHAALARVLRLAGSSGEAEKHALAGRAILDRVTASVKDQALRDHLRERANP